jgi:hypothetical protein
MTIDLNELDQKWDKKWPKDVNGLVTQLKDREIWVRFHTLPNSKRYPENKEELNVILDRHHILLEELQLNDMCYLFLSDWTNTQDPTISIWNEHKAVGIKGTHWRTVMQDPEETDPEFKSYRQLYVSEYNCKDDTIDALLEAVANDTMAGVIIAPLGLQWLYHPYDGGVDIFLASTGQRDILKDRHHDWLSRHSSGS